MVNAPTMKTFNVKTDFSYCEDDEEKLPLMK